MEPSRHDALPLVGPFGQAQDGDLSAIAALSPADDDVIQRKAGAWTNRTMLQLKADLSLSGVNTGDQTSIVGISGTIAQFNAACSDADFATGGGTATGTNTGDQSSIVGISGTKANFDAACSDGDFAYQSDLSSYLTTAVAATSYQPLDTQLSDLAALAYGGNSLKVVRVNAGETALELATVSGGGGGGAAGTATVDFGAFPGRSHASVAVTGQASLIASSVVEAWIAPSATADHTADEHMLEPLRVFVSDLIAGTGFTIHVFSDNRLSEPLEPPGIGRRHRASTTTGQNFGAVSGVAGSVGGALPMPCGQYTVNWRWQ